MHTLTLALYALLLCWALEILFFTASYWLMRERNEHVSR